MAPTRRLLLIAIALSLLAPATAPLAHAQGLARQRADTFTPVDCAEFIELSAGESFDAATECGYLSVPELHARPDGPSIELAVVILRSSSTRPEPDPLVMAQGGPGGSTIDTYATTMQDSLLRAARDIVLFDQRGTHYARPALHCPESIELTISTIEQDLDVEEASRRSAEATLACRARLAREGVNLAAYNSLENAADVEALRVALGYATINLYGVSYGTLLAQHVLRDFSAGLRSVILDAVEPTSVNVFEEIARSEDRALSELFGACRADARCDAAYPELERTFYAQVERLNAQPARVPMTDSETGTTYQAVLDGDALQDLVFQMLYASELLPLLPQLIDDVQRDRYPVLRRVASQLIFDRTMSTGMYYSVNCAEDADYDPQAVASAGLRPQVAERALRSARWFVELCAGWGVPPLGPAVDAPVTSDVPTLVLNGRFDPILPPAFGEQLAASLTRSYVYTFPDVGHGALLKPCADAIVSSFLDDPSGAPDAACLAELGPPRFVVPDDVLRLPALLDLLNLEGGSVAELLLYAAALALLLSAWLVLPLAWLIRRFQGTPAQPAPLLARAAPWLALLNGALLALFPVVLLALVVAQLGEDALILVGVPRAWAPLLLVPPLCAGLTALGASGVEQAWRHGAWGVPRRAYSLILVAAGAVCVALLVRWGMLMSPFLP